MRRSNIPHPHRDFDRAAPNPHGENSFSIPEWFYLSTITDREKIIRHLRDNLARNINPASGLELRRHQNLGIVIWLSEHNLCRVYNEGRYLISRNDSLTELCTFPSLPIQSSPLGLLHRGSNLVPSDLNSRYLTDHLSAFHFNETHPSVCSSHRKGFSIGRERQTENFYSGDTDGMERRYFSGPVSLQLLLLPSVRSLVEDLLNIIGNRAVVIRIKNRNRPVSIKTTDCCSVLTLCIERDIPDPAWHLGEFSYDVGIISNLPCCLSLQTEHLGLPIGSSDQNLVF